MYRVFIAANCSRMEHIPSHLVHILHNPKARIDVVHVDQDRRGQTHKTFAGMERTVHMLTLPVPEIA
eukprot:942530-Rhodomonas_salina.2